MDILSVVKSLLGIIGSILTGGILTALIGLRYVKRKERAAADQAEEQVKSMSLNNAGDAIAIYKTALADIKNLHRQTEEEYAERLRLSEAKIEHYENQINQYKEPIASQEVTIHELVKNQVSLKLEMSNLRNEFEELKSKMGYGND